MQSLENNHESLTNKLSAIAFDKQTIANEIEHLVKCEGLSYLEASSWWLEERSISENQFSKYIPDAIVEMIKQEVLEDNLLKPSLAKVNTHSTLDFLYG